MRHPILIEVTRGPLVESVHTGSLAVAMPSGELFLALGDVSAPLFPRSSVKALQCLPLIETGAASRFGYGHAEIALACASHTGTERHTRIAAGMLAAAGFDEAALGCGAHRPLGEKAARTLLSHGGTATQLHNNCSGKHAGMLATARHAGEPVERYWEASHPVQARIRQTASELAEMELDPDQFGVDGCSVPTWAMPLSALARVFAKFGAGEGMDPRRAEAARRIREACWAEPELVAGPGRADTVIMARLPGRVFLKTGAEGVYCGAFPELKLGFALKIDDGATRASVGTATALVEQLYPQARGLFDRQSQRSWRGAEVGRIRSSEPLRCALNTLAHSVKVC